MRNPAPSVHPRDPVLGPLRGFLDWVHRRLDAEIPPLATATKAWDPPNIAASPGTASTTVTVPGAQLAGAMPVMVAFSRAVPAGAALVGAVTAQDTVTVTLINLTGGALNLAAGELRVSVWRYGT